MTQVSCICRPCYINKTTGHCGNPRCTFQHSDSHGRYICQLHGRDVTNVLCFPPRVFNPIRPIAFPHRPVQQVVSSLAQTEETKRLKEQNELLTQMLAEMSKTNVPGKRYIESDDDRRNDRRYYREHDNADDYRRNDRKYRRRHDNDDDYRRNDRKYQRTDNDDHHRQSHRRISQHHHDSPRRSPDHFHQDTREIERHHQNFESKTDEIKNKETGLSEWQQTRFDLYLKQINSPLDHHA